MQADVLLAVVAGAVVAVVLLSLAVLFFKANKSADFGARGESDEVVAAGRSTGRRNRMAAGMQRRRRATAAPAHPDTVNELSDEEGVGDDEEEEEEEGTGGSRAERRAARREARREQRQEQRQAMDGARAAKEAKRQAIEERYRAREAEREAAEKAALDALKKAEEERLQREEEEAAKWRQYFSVEEEGQDAEEDETAGQSRVQQFITFIKDSKAVQLDELAAEFKLTTADVIQRISQLEEEGQLTGVMDDRGKFIYIAREEMEAVAAFIVQRGRVSIAELAHKSSSFIDLTPKAQADGAISAADLDLDDTMAGPAAATITA